MDRESRLGIYFGRFQPPLIKHAEIVRSITENHPDVTLTVGVADAPHEQSQSNFLLGDEVLQLFEQTLSDLGIDGVQLRKVLIDPAIPFAESVRKFMESQTRNLIESITVFSGSPSTIKACEQVSKDRDINIVRLDDDDNTGPRARHIREALVLDQPLTEVSGLVVPDVAQYLDSPMVRQRIKKLPTGAKRPWTIIRPPLLNPIP